MRPSSFSYSSISIPDEIPEAQPVPRFVLRSHAVYRGGRRGFGFFCSNFTAVNAESIWVLGPNLRKIVLRSALLQFFF